MRYSCKLGGDEAMGGTGLGDERSRYEGCNRGAEGVQMRKWWMVTEKMMGCRDEGGRWPRRGSGKRDKD